jgi:ornithine cyclodeaminase/alanine dehydrogenase-like protein (mu-crystallin family)
MQARAKRERDSAKPQAQGAAVNKMTLLLNNDDVEKALTPEGTITATEQIYRELAEGAAFNRPRSQVYLPVQSKNNPGFQYRMKTQEGGSAGTGVWALRVTSDMAGHSFTNGVKRRRILPVATGNRYCGMVILFDIERIEPVAIMPDGVIQKMRVAALSAVGAKYLAPEKPRTLALFGSGWQAGAHLEYLCSLFAFERIKVFSPNSEHCRMFAESMSRKLDRRVDAVGSPRDAVDGSDFLQAATAAWDPVFDGHWVERGMYVASIGGSDGSNKRREIDDETIRRADVYIVHSKEVAQQDKSPDIWEAAEKGIKPWDSIHEIQDLLVGKVAGRTNADQITLFNNNTGAGTQFAAVGAAVLKRAKELGLGKELPTEWFLEDVSP